MLINSDWHIHSESSYYASNSLDSIAEGAEAQGLLRIGITDHLNFNDESFVGDLKRSAASVREAQKKYTNMVLGVELTPIELPEFEYISKHGTREGYEPPCLCEPFGIELAMTKAELMELGVRYAVTTVFVSRLVITHASRMAATPPISLPTTMGIAKARS